MTRDLNPDQSKAILDLLRSLGEVSDKRIEELLSSTPLTDIMGAAIETVHTLACRKEHAQPESGVVPRDEVRCFFYMEDGFENPWEGKDHQTWLREAMTLMKELGIESEDELMEFLNEATEVAGKVSRLAGKYIASMKFIRRIIIVPTRQ